jgi:regulator of protease activity HflC (stomatin/prohibitin superfamily)
MKTPDSSQNREQVVSVFNGWTMLILYILGIAAATFWMIQTIRLGERSGGPDSVPLIASILLQVVGYVCLSGFFTLQPNEARVLILFGKYKGTVRSSGFHWGNPFYSNGQATIVQTGAPSEKPLQAGLHFKQFRARRNKISLRARNLNSEKLKVNDKRGNPIEIGAVVVWRVQDTAQAMFDVDDYENYVRVQSESAIRHLASRYAYDHGEENETTLRSGVDEISQALQVELQARLEKAGVAVDEARLTHLAYAPEIAQAMLRRQQAEAVIAARQKIVQGAVSMVDMALRELSEKKVVELDDDRRAAMVSNLMVVLCGESEVHPVVNTGTLYS